MKCPRCGKALRSKLVIGGCWWRCVTKGCFWVVLEMVTQRRDQTGRSRQRQRTFRPRRRSGEGRI